MLLYGDALLFLVFKEKTAYDMRISDWSSDVCSSDLAVFTPAGDSDAHADELQAMAASPDLVSRMSHAARERACRYSLTSMAAETARLYRAHLPMKIHRLAGALA